MENKTCSKIYISHIFKKREIFLELLTESVFFGRYRSVFLGIYHTDTEGKLGQYFRYQKIGGSPSKNWREPPFSQEGGASAPSLYTSPSF